MKTKFLVLLLVPILWNCRQKEEKTPQRPEPILKEESSGHLSGLEGIADFLDISLIDSSDAVSKLRFWKLDQNNIVDSTGITEAVDLYHKFNGPGKRDIYPIFEVKDNTNVMLLMSDKGFGGNIRGTFLIDKNTLEIKKVVFEHMAESEGYGAAISLSSFEDQFVGTKVDFQENTFGLNQNDRTIIKGDKVVDGISGATITSRLTVEMINDALKVYKGFFDKMSQGQ